MTWAAAIVAHLRQSKRAGDSFENAWASALQMYPPRGRDRWGEGPVSLFDPPTETVVEFTRRVCEDAWNGRHPQLRHFSADALRDGRLPEDDPAVAA